MRGFRGALLAVAAVSLVATGARANSVTTKRVPEANTEPNTKANTKATVRTHVVVTGDNLWDIARAYDCMPEDLKRVNKIRSNMIRPGNKLTIPHCSSHSANTTGITRRSRRNSKRKPKGTLFHEVESGDTLFRIANKYGTTVDDIKMRNGISSNIVILGQQLDVVPGSGGGNSGRAIKGQSVGRAHSGRLVGATRLSKGKGYLIRRPKRAFGANHAVHAVKRAISAVRRRHSKLHTLAIGDLSVRNGGKISQHRSHQSGRDVDIGFYFKKQPKSYPVKFVRGSKSNLNLKATWTLVSAFSSMADADNGVERIFLDYGIQKLVYKWAKGEGVSHKILRKTFQYPHGKRSPTGLIRHQPGHADHLHIRFKCPADDKRCL